MKRYDPKQIEKKWQDIWERKKLNIASENSRKKKYYVLVEFPYPSGEGLHIGHIRSYTALDIVARKRRAEGYNVLYPMGWDAFGLPTENYAIKTGIHPKIVTKKNTDTFRRQLKSLGFSFDWTREINTTDPHYYKWTQWIFLQFFKKDLAYKAKRPINWCPSCKIGLADEEVLDGNCERCGTKTEKRDKEQWMLAITKYADRLDRDLDDVDFLEKIKIQQRNWIGKSEGAEIDFDITGRKEKVTIFTTRPDTLYGATYLVLAPEHPLVAKFSEKISNKKELGEYVRKAAKKSEIERTTEGKEKSGVELKGVKAINPATKKEVPIYVADYVLAHYGTGAIMAVPAHDERDYSFAKKFKLPVVQVIEPVYEQTTEPGKIRKGEPYDERDAIIAIVKHWSEDKYMGLKWKEVAWGTFITGGIEKGQTAEEAAKMEIKEETGFLNPKLVTDFGRVHGKFYHVPKKVNRFAHARVLYFELQNESKAEVAEEEQKRHEVLWLREAELEKFLTPDTHKHSLRLLNGSQGSYRGEGILTNSGKFDGVDSGEAKKEITKFVGGRSKTTFKLRDWVFSRQRYWGEPIPIIHCKKCGMVPVPEKDLPVMLPNVKSYKPNSTGESPLAAISSWVNVTCPNCGEKAKRETDVMPNWAGSSWYFLRYADPKNKKTFAGKQALKYWIPVDWYNGGMEHVTLHLLYSRFWYKFLYDLKLVPGKEPYKKRTSHGLILAKGGVKMSKSKGNIVNPDSIVKLLGADTLRHYEMFMGPFDQAIVWNTDAVAGSRRYLERVFKLIEKVEKGKEHKKQVVNSALESLFHQTIKKVTEDIEELKMNTVLSQLMILLNAFEKEEKISRMNYATYLRLLAPVAPHITEELWNMLGEKSSIHLEPWPQWDPKKLLSESVSIAVQVNGKLKATVSISRDLDDDEAQGVALAHPNILRIVFGKTIKRIVYVKGKIVNIVM
jgi:leucyl-tRNA synthetase